MKTFDVIVTITAYTNGNPHHSMGTRAFKYDDGSIGAAVEINGVAAVLAHEMVHATVGLEAGHGPKFRKKALEIGLEGKMTATRPGEAFKRAIAPILSEVGPLPHARLRFGNSSGPKKQTTRLVKVACPKCGYTVRITKKWLSGYGAPLCPIHLVPLVTEGTQAEEEGAR